MSYLLWILLVLCLWTCKGSADSDLCGVPRITPADSHLLRIVGGQEAKPNSWPWQCRLTVRLVDGRYSEWCGASVLTSRHLVTAAHCMFYEGARIPTRSYKAYCGDHSQIQVEPNEQRVSVSRITIHERYNPSSVDYDIAVITLSPELTLNDYVQPICLPYTDVPDGTLCLVTGWGSTKGTGSDIKLRQTFIPILPQAVCRSSYSTLSYSIVTNNMLCAGNFTYGGKDSCQGDSGGPLSCQVNGVWQLHGIVSWGEGCAQPHLPGVYTRVTAFKSWIQHQIGDMDYRVTLTDVSVKSGETVKLPCLTTSSDRADWRFQPHPTVDEVYVNYSTTAGQFLPDPYKPRFAVNVTSLDDYTLTIHNVRVNDSGLYHCVEVGGLGKRQTVRLSVSQSDAWRYAVGISSVIFVLVLTFISILYAFLEIRGRQMLCHQLKHVLAQNRVTDPGLHRVCEVNNEGVTVKSYGGSRG